MNLKTNLYSCYEYEKNINTLTKGVVFFFITTLFLFSSCSKKNSEKNKAELTKIDTLIAPVSISIANPIVVNLDTCPAPQTNIIPTKSGNQTTIYNGRLIKLKPPEIKPADFYSIMQAYTSDQGLALDAVSCAKMDKKGNLWFGTTGGGISCYNGKSFTTYTKAQGLVNNTIVSILEDKKGDLWFGTDEGLSRYDGNFFTTYTKAQGLINNVFLSLSSFEDKKGNLWFGTLGGLSRYDGKSFTNYTISNGLPSNYVFCFTEDKEGNLWCGTHNGLSRYDGKSFANYTTVQGLPNKDIRSIKMDKGGNLWCGTFNWVSCFNGKSFTNYTVKQNLTDNKVLCIEEDKRGNLWFGTNKGGVLSYDGKSFTNYTTAQGLANNNVNSITEDKMGNMWFGTYGGGVSRYDGKSCINYTTAQGLTGNLVLCITEDKKGNLWFGTYANGAIRYDGKSFTHFASDQGFSNEQVISIKEDQKGNIWFGTYGNGVSRYDGKSFTNYRTNQGLAHNIVMSIKEDQKGNLWFGTFGGGVSRYDGRSFTNYTTAQGLTNNKIWNIKEDKKGNLWFGTYGGGVFCYNGKSFTNYTTAQGLANDDVRVITEDKEGNLWFGTAGNGISRYDGKSFLSYTTFHGLSDNMINQVVITKEQNIAIGTNLGMSVLVSFHIHESGRNAESIPAQNNLTNDELKSATPVFEIYNSTKGYPIKDVNYGQDGIFKDSKGMLWIGTGSDKTGLVRFDYKEVNRSEIPPAVFIQNIKIDNENICWYDLNMTHMVNPMHTKNDSNIAPANITEEVTTLGRALNEAERDTMYQKFGDIKFDGITSFYYMPENLILPYKHNNVTFDFSAIEPAKPYLVRYQYLLEGYDKNWSPVTNKTTATFGNINEGLYTFKLKAQSPFGIWSTPVMYTFKVLPPWWRTWWMYGVYGILVITFIVWIVRWNGKRLKTRAKELTQEVRKATEEIVEQKKIVEEKKKIVEEKSKIVEEKNKNIMDSINYALRIQTAFLPRKEEISVYLPQSFILFKPKDIVSGDFYFFHKTTSLKYKTGEELLFIAAADCTGHGVPGAFLSMVGSERLTDAIQQSSNPSEILSLLNKGVKNSLHQSNKDESTRDGMDIAICVVDIENRIVNYAGANRPLWLIRKEQNEIEEIKGTKTAIGGLTADNQSFESHELTLKQGDTFYIFSDGYADIFSGQNNKKLTTRKFKQILLDIQDKTMPEQEHYLEDFMETWKAGTEQIDDILVIGIRV
jgi:ligand-binding sensor domain-containing protein/serine phosphatase RsbU (regulator of sigma subunit)